MKKSLLAIAALAAGFTMSAQQTVFYSEDFEWLAPWLENYTNGDGKHIGNTVGDNDVDAYCPFIDTPKLDGVSAQAAMEEKGMVFHYAENGKTPEASGKCIYLQQDYLKFGKKNFQGGITLPSIENVPAGTEASISFDWTPMRAGANAYDPTVLIVVVTNGEDVKTFNVPALTLEDGAPLKWFPTEVKLEGVAITKDTKITIRPEDSQWFATGQHRWFIDNINVYAEATGIDAVVADENAPVEYFNLQGIRVNEPANGLYIRRQGNAVTKVMVK